MDPLNPNPQAQPGSVGPSDTVGMIGPDGNPYDIPHANVSDAVKDGGRIGADVLGPDGKGYLIPLEKVHGALLDGGKLMGHFQPRVAEPAGLRSGPTQNTDEHDQGAVAGIERASKALALLPVAVWHSVVDHPRDEIEHAIFAQGGPLMLAYKRLVVDPQIATSERGDQYAASAKAKKESGYKAEAKDAANPVQGDEHMARMMHFASLIPLLGPMSANLTERGVEGDPAGASTEILSQLAAGAALHGAGEHLKGVGPTTAKVGDVDVPILASQQGSKAAALWEGVAKKLGANKPFEKFAERQQAAGQEAVSSVAKKGAAAQVGKMSPTKGGVAPAQQVAFARTPAEVADAVEDSAKTLATGPKRASLENQAQALREFDADFRSSMKPGVPKGTRALKSAKGNPVNQPEPELDAENWSAKLDKMGNDRLKQAFGGNSKHVADIRDLAGVLQDGQNAAKMSIMLKFLHASGAAEIFSKVSGSDILAKVLTNPKATATMVSAFKIGASAPVIAQAVVNSIQPEKKQ